MESKNVTIILVHGAWETVHIGDTLLKTYAMKGML